MSDRARCASRAVALDGEALRTAWVRDAQDARTKRQGLLDQYQELKEQRQRIVKAGPEGDCPTCARPLGAEYDKVLELLDRQMEEVVSNGNFYKQRIEQLQVEPRELEEADRRRRRARARAVRGHRGAEPARGAGPGGRRAAAKSTAGCQLRVRELEAAIEPGARLLRPGPARGAGGRDPRARAARAPGRAPARRGRPRHRRRGGAGHGRPGARRRRPPAPGELRARLGGLGYTEQTLPRGARGRGRGRARAPRGGARAGARAGRVGRGRGGGRGRGAPAGRARPSGSGRPRPPAPELALHQELDRALTDLRTELNATLRPDLSDLASGFLRDLTNGRYTDLELDEDYGATLLDDGDPKAVISGGEEDVANLALRLAISQMIAERAGQPLSLLILDEIFGSLDEDRRAAVVDLLRSLADRFPQVILITHIDSVREGFDRVVRVGFDLARAWPRCATSRSEGHDVAA